MLTDPVADMLARLKNANKALHESVEMPASNLKTEIARLLRDEGYIKDYRIDKGESFDTLVIELKFGPKRERIITDLKRISKPGRRVYVAVRNLPRINNGLGVAILSTPKGVMADHDAREANVGGEIICTVF